MRLRPVLQLIRLPNHFSAAADSLAGWLLIGGSLHDTRSYLHLMAASVLLYSGGIVLNDYADVEIDRRERPTRPLPSGSVSKNLALGLIILCFALGVLFAALSCVSGSLGVALVLCMFIVAYDLVLRRTIFGPAAMGACRGLNLLLGMSAAMPKLPDPLVLIVLAYATFVAGITLLSRFEAESRGAQPVVVGLATINVALIGLAVAVLWPAFHHIPSRVPTRPFIPFESLLLLALVAWFVNLSGGRALLEPSPTNIQNTIKRALLSLTWLHIATLVALRGPIEAAVVAALWLPAVLAARWLYAT